MQVRLRFRVEDRSSLAMGLLGLACPIVFWLLPGRGVDPKTLGLFLGGGLMLLLLGLGLLKYWMLPILGGVLVFTIFLLLSAPLWVLILVGPLGALVYHGAVKLIVNRGLKRLER